MRPHYSGALSTKFWKSVHALPEPDKSTLYALGCVLQNVESDVLRWLRVAEDESNRATGRPESGPEAA